MGPFFSCIFIHIIKKIKIFRLSVFGVCVCVCQERWFFYKTLLEQRAQTEKFKIILQFLRYFFTKILFSICYNIIVQSIDPCAMLCLVCVPGFASLCYFRLEVVWVYLMKNKKTKSSNKEIGLLIFASAYLFRSFVDDIYIYPLFCSNLKVNITNFYFIFLFFCYCRSTQRSL